MKRVLVLTYYVPPRAAVASLRVGHLLRTLPRFGWEVLTVTPDFGDAPNAEHLHSTTAVVDFKAPMRRLLGVGSRQTTHERLGVERGTIIGARSWSQRALRLGYDVGEYANRSFGWVGPGSRAIARVLAEHRVDAILSTSPPETVHLVAARMHGSIPWIADFRDPWLKDGERPGALVAMDRALEARTLRSASVLTTVSEPLAAELRERFPRVPVVSIPNAYARNEWEALPFVEPQHATFVYAGQLYNGRRDPRPFFEALAQVMRDRLVRPEEIRVEFFGDDDPWLDAMVRRYGIGGIVRLYGNVPREDVLRRERTASRLLLFLRDHERERGTFTGKFFEYLGARRRILAIGGPESSVLDDVLARTGAGERYRTIAGIRDAIVQSVAEWRRARTPIVDEAAVAPYEAEHLGEAFARVLDAASGHARSDAGA